MNNNSGPMVKNCIGCKASMDLYFENPEGERTSGNRVFFGEKDKNKGGMAKFCHNCHALIWVPCNENEEVQIWTSAKDQHATGM